MNLLAIVLAALCAAWKGVGGADGPPPRDAAPSVSGPVRWMENRGQWPERFAFVARGSGTTVGVTRESVVIERAEEDELLRAELVFEGASADVVVEGAEIEPGLHHYYHGSDPARWVRNARWFREVRLRGLYAGIDLELREEAGRLKYDVRVAPHADLSALVVRCEGAGGLVVDGEGALVLGAQEIVQPPGRSWQEAPGGRRVPVAVVHRRIDERRFGFEAAERDPTLPLVIDPELVWSTYWGGRMSSGIEGVADAAVDGFGHVTVVGDVEGSGSFQTETSFQSPFFGTDDAFVAKFRQSDGSLVYSSRIGAEDHEEASAVAVDAMGRAYVVGSTGQTSFAFPTTPGAFDPVKTLAVDSGFALRLSPLGETLEYSTFLDGAGGRTEAHGVAVADSGAAIVAGFTSADGLPGFPGFPTTAGSFDPTLNGSDDVFVTRLDPTGSFLEWSTLLGGVGPDLGFDLVMAEDETVFITGKLGSPDFPTTPNAFQPAAKFLTEAFVTKLAADGASLVWSTYVSGFGTDIARSIAVSPMGHVAISGTTDSLDFPTTPGAFQETRAALGDDAFVTVLDASGARLRYSTYLGGDGNELGSWLTMDASGMVTATGSSGSGFPLTPGAFQTSGSTGGFVSRFDPSGGRLVYSTFLGPTTGIGSLEGITRSPDDRFTVVGLHTGPYPTTANALFPNRIGGAVDGVITTFDLFLDGVSPAGTSRPSCLGPLNMNATEMPRAGEPFGVYCSQAPPFASGFLLVSPADASGGRVESALSSVRPVQVDADGFVETRLGSLTGTRGSVFRCRYVFFDSPGCPGPSSLSWSNALVVRVR